MSYVLKALKKSQQARDLGSVPTLANSPDIEPEQEPSGRRWPWVISSVLLLNVAVLGFFLWQSSPNASLGSAFASVRALVAPEKTGAMAEGEIAGTAGEPLKEEMQAQTGLAAAQNAAPSAAPSNTAGDTASAADLPREADLNQVAMAPAANPDAEAADKLAAAKARNREALEKRKAAAKKRKEAAEARRAAVKAKREARAAKRAEAKAKREEAARLRAEAKSRKAAEKALAAAETEATETEIEAPVTAALKQPPIPQPKPILQRASVSKLPDFTEKQQAIAERQKLAKAVPGDEEIAETVPSTAAPNAEMDRTFQTLPFVSDLPQEFRNAIPDLAVSLHVYDKLPDRRFVRINKKKYREGDKLKEGPMLDAIVPEGMVLSYRNKQFILPN